MIFFPGATLYYSMLDAQQITLRFLDTRLQVHPDVVRYIQEQDNPELIDRIIAAVPEDAVVVSAKHIPGMNATRDGMRFLTDPTVEIVSGGPGTSGSVNGTADYLHYFRDRYSPARRDDPEQVRGDANRRADPLARYRQEECTVIGMVVEVKTTTNGHRIAETRGLPRQISGALPEGPAGLCRCRAHDPGRGDRGQGKTLKRREALLCRADCYRPDIRIDNKPFMSEQPGKAVFISDVHVGSNTFLRDCWNRFVDWISESDASYLLIAGDLVDGIGVFPGQEQELTIKNIYEQYDAFGEMISAISRPDEDHRRTRATTTWSGAPSPSR